MPGRERAVPPLGVMSASTVSDGAQRFTDLYRQHHTRVRDFAQFRVGRKLAPPERS